MPHFGADMTLDTVHLHLTDYSIAEGNSLTIQPSPYIASTGEKVSDFHLFRDEAGREQTGSRAYLNVPDKFQLTLQPFTKCQAGVNCFVQFSVPRVHYGNNYYSVGEEGSQAVFNSIEKELWQAGIHTDINTADLCRVDTFKNIEPEEEFSAYMPVLGLLKMRRGADRQYPEGFLLKNTQQQFCVYDKIAEMQKRKVDTSRFPAMTMRFEHRCMNKDKVQSVFGFHSVKELFSGGYETVKVQQVNQWKNNLFSQPVEEIIVEGAKTLEAEMKYYREQYPNSWFERFLRGYGAKHLVENTGIEVVKYALKSFEVDRKKVWRAEKTLEQAKREIDMLKQVEGRNKTLGTLYLELREKVCLN
jgi:hypothetical protein